MESQTNTLKIAAIGDLHTKETDKGRFSPIFQKLSKEAGILLLAGDLTDTGDENEAEVLLSELAHCSIPVVCVLGNHDYEKGRQKLIKQVLLQNNNLNLLDGEGVIIKGVGFAGVKGFGGGFDNYMLSMFGESEMKDFVGAAVDESLRLERALAGLDKYHQVKKIALMHYAPSSQTVAGEPEALYPFLGCSRLAEPLVRQKVQAVFHGHAHGGTLAGMIAKVKVFNVAEAVLYREGIEDGYLIYEMEV